MSIRARLSIAFAVLLVIATVLIGIAVVRTTRAAMVDDIDARLRELQAIRLPGGDRVFRRDGEVLRRLLLDTDDDSYREIAELVVTVDGDVLFVRPAGFPSDPESPPELPATLIERLARDGDTIATVDAADGSLKYRVLTRTDGEIVRVYAASLADVESTTSDLLRAVLAAGSIIVVAGAGFAWWIVGRGLRPVDRMIDTASAIAAGDLGRRIEHRDDRTELGRLAHALDDMLTQLEQAFAERAASEAQLRRFVADASHELRTPVTSIRGYAELYGSGGIEAGEPLDRAMARIGSESERMGRLVEDLLLLARLDQHQPLEALPVDLRGLAADAVADATAIDVDTRVTLADGETVVVLGDEARLRQVLANLLTNARVHTPEGTVIDVAVSADDEMGRLAVHDEGPGILPEHRERIFDRFYRADASRTRATGGSGLGLSIVAAIVEAHGGQVGVESEPGRGTTFVVELPLAPRTATG